MDERAAMGARTAAVALAKGRRKRAFMLGCVVYWSARAILWSKGPMAEQELRVAWRNAPDEVLRARGDEDRWGCGMWC